MLVLFFTVVIFVVLGAY